MASADVRDELDCSICLNIYSDPVTLRCGHNFCRLCIDRVLDCQEASGVYECPECREAFPERPAPNKNTTLSNIALCFLSAELQPPESQILCTNCIHASVAAVKSCLLCECSLCGNHLRVHSSAPEHVLLEPTHSFANRKCRQHKKILEYVCTDDGAFICVVCRLDGEHKTHKIRLMEDVSDQKKEELKHLWEQARSRQEKVGERVQKLKERGRKAEEKAAGETQAVEAVFDDLRRHLEELRQRVLSEISKQRERASLSIARLIRELEAEQDEMSAKMQQIEKLLQTTDSFTILQEGDLLVKSYDQANDQGVDRDDKTHDGNLDEAPISGALRDGLSDFLACVKKIPPQEAAEVLLDLNTACEDIEISGDLKTISRSEMRRNHPQMFQYYPQVLSASRFSSGRCSWEVETSDVGNWRIGVSYPTIVRTGDCSYLGDNDKSWCLRRYNSQYSAIHDGKEVPLTQMVSSHRLKVCLDYEEGTVAFYELGDPIRHLHTFTATFSEPLHAAFCVWDDWVRIST